MSLAIETARGQDGANAQHLAAAWLAQRWGYDVWESSDHEASALDVVFARGGVIMAIGEIKRRYMDMAQLRRYDSLILSCSKMDAGQAVSRAWRVPYVVVAALDDSMACWQMTDKGGRWLVAFDSRQSITKATVNGGQAMRLNAYIALDKRMHVYWEIPY